MSNNIPEVLRKVVEAQGKIDRGAMMARNEMMTSLIQLSKEQIQGKRQKGEKAESGKPPKNRTGNLRRKNKFKASAKKVKRLNQASHLKTAQVTCADLFKASQCVKVLLPILR